MSTSRPDTDDTADVPTADAPAPDTAAPGTTATATGDGSGPTVADLGEFGLIRAITRRLPAGPDVLLGPGDDAAVVASADGRVVITTDLLLEGRHFRRDWSSAYDVGRKAAAQNLSDVVAMGARPTALVVGLGAPRSLPIAWAEQFADGLRDECELVGASVAGGDISSSDTIVLGITALGDLAGRAPVRRDTARGGDLVVLAGRLGWAQAGLALLRATTATTATTGAASATATGTAATATGSTAATGGTAAAPAVRLDDPEYAELVAAHRRPQPPYPLGPQLAAAGAHAMCDVSDGLLADLGHIAAASSVWVDLDTALIPVPARISTAAAALGADPLGWVLTGGDDHALVACVAPGTELPAGCTVIGRVLNERPADAGTRDHGVLVNGRDQHDQPGWDHFA
ncbi:thiamine-phosphate kinase [Frankia sp. CcI49]|uniref:thiamine-phosphate kinase n=1 Tax=Frankia sp. CcI49 TaxID=1745382 RepID=UPI000976517D|nr:thiamine-phosphate kinase [Frankia sp. CcI49]ONH53521.1 thiamine-phosphate kinase [Frankia sp. CcI49]